MNVVLAPRALRDLESIAAYLNERNPSATTNVLASIKSSIEALSAFPEIGVALNEAGHRRKPVLRYPYVVYYRIARNELLILHIRHTSRRPINPASEL